MPSFICENCGCVDNSACGGTYWTANADPPLYPPPYKKGQKLCLACSPTIYTNGRKNGDAGKWHDKFERLMPDGSLFKSNIGNKFSGPTN
jgi:hypothetical protein